MCLGLKLTAEIGDIELLNWNFLDVCQGTQAFSSVKSLGYPHESPRVFHLI